ncbi:hypothetical protein MRB53_037191 [Persea americana]|nr:hypothetical protein MRB53_037191 [Persea americana]
MSQAAKPKTSRWGSLLSGAVAGLESRLDNILADEASVKERNAKAAQIGFLPKESVIEVRGRESSDFSSASSLRKDSQTRTGGSTRSSIDIQGRQDAPIRPASQVPSRALTPLPTAQARASFESTLSENLHSQAAPSTADTETQAGDSGAIEAVENGGEAGAATSEARVVESVGEATMDRRSHDSSTHEDSNHIVVANGKPTIVVKEAPYTSIEEAQKTIADLRQERERSELERQEEVHAHIERIDALHAKLQYLTKEAAEYARSTAQNASRDSLEQQLAEKDEKIAALIEEGQKISKAEVGYSMAIRKLRVRMTEETNELAQTRQRLKRAEALAAELTEKDTHSQADLREARSKASRFANLEREVEKLRVDRETHQATVESLRKQLSELNHKYEALDNTNHVNLQAFAAEQRLAQSLRDDIGRLKHDQKAVEDKIKADAQVLQQRLTQETDRNKAAEIGLRNEIQNLESRLELSRERNEEASSGSTSDAQVKLMRHIETLQSQYAVANENWQGIESSLQSRVTALEIERDEAAKHEAESRKKAREAQTLNRKLQEELDATSSQTDALRQDLLDQRRAAEQLQTRADDFDKVLRETKASFDRERAIWETSLATKIKEEKAKWQQESLRSPSSEQPFPQFSDPFPRQRSYIGLNQQERPGSMRRNFSRFSNSPEVSIAAHSQRTTSRTTPAIRVRPSTDDYFTSPLESGQGTPRQSSTPSMKSVDDDETVEASTSPHRTVNDMVSVSTTAGPSVQLVSSMSARVRLLESEKVAAKDEIARLLSQRDGARQEVVALMKEAEAKREADAKVAKLEKELSAMEQRYQTTLEMMGEKSEQVEELRADVADLKKIYRELVESTMK